MPKILTEEQIDELLEVDYIIFSKKDISIIKDIKNKFFKNANMKDILLYKFISYNDNGYFMPNENIKLGFILFKIDENENLIIKKIYNLLDDFLLYQRVCDFYPKIDFEYISCLMDKMKKYNTTKNLEYYDLSYTNGIYFDDTDILLNYNIKQAYEYLRFMFIKKYIKAELAGY